MHDLRHLLCAALLGLPAVAAAEQCGEPSSVADLTETLDRIDKAYQTADSVDFFEALDVLGPQLDCTDEILPRSLIARIHRTQGLGAFANQEGMRLAQAFAAAKAIDPDYRFPASFVPAGHPVARNYAEAEPSDETVPFEPPRTGFLLLDGEPVEVRPTQRAVVVQHIVGRNTVAFTGYMEPEDRIPPPGLQGESTSTTKTSTHRGRPFWIASIATATLGAVTYGVAASRRSAYENAAPVDKPGLRTQTNGLVQVSAGLGGVAVGTAVVGLVVGQK